MAWDILAGQALGAAGSIYGGAGQGAPAAPTISEGGNVNVSVGGLNVPAFPLFPNYSKASVKSGVVSNTNNDLLIYAVLGVVLIVLIKKK